MKMNSPSERNAWKDSRTDSLKKLHLWQKTIAPG